MDPTNPSNSSSVRNPPQTAADLPPEALALAQRLFQAAREGQTEIFEHVLARSDRIANLTNEKGDSLIMLASYHGHLPLTQLLLRHSADPNRLNDRLQSPLAGAIFKAEDAVVEALLAGGADPRIGQPSAVDAVQIFGQQAKWAERMDRAVREMDEREEGGREATRSEGKEEGGEKGDALHQESAKVESSE